MSLTPPPSYTSVLQERGIYAHYADIATITEVMGLTRPAVYKAIGRGDLPSAKTPGGQNVILALDVDAWMRRRWEEGLKSM